MRGGPASATMVPSEIISNTAPDRGWIVSIIQDDNKSDRAVAKIDPAQVRFTGASLSTVSQYGSILKDDLRHRAAARAAAEGREVVRSEDIQAVTVEVLAGLIKEFETGETWTAEK